MFFKSFIWNKVYISKSPHNYLQTSLITLCICMHIRSEVFKQYQNTFMQKKNIYILTEL